MNCQHEIRIKDYPYGGGNISLQWYVDIDMLICKQVDT